MRPIGLPVVLLVALASQVSFSYARPASPALRRLAAAPSSLGRNLIVNGDAESGAGATDASVVPVPGWSGSASFTAVRYGTVVSSGSSAGTFPTPTDPGPLDRGANFFAGGPNAATTQASQTIDVSTDASVIDAAPTYYVLTGYLGGYEDQRDSATVTATFQDSSGAPLGSAHLTPVQIAERGGKTGLLLRGVIGNVPVGTRSIVVQLQMTRGDGAYNDGYVDSLSLVLTSTLSTVWLPVVSRS